MVVRAGLSPVVNVPDSRRGRRVERPACPFATIQRADTGRRARGPRLCLATLAIASFRLGTWPVLLCNGSSLRAPLVVCGDLTVGCRESRFDDVAGVRAAVGSLMQSAESEGAPRPA
jgi:hypothetical protein